MVPGAINDALTCTVSIPAKISRASRPFNCLVTGRSMDRDASQRNGNRTGATPLYNSSCSGNGLHSSRSGIGVPRS
jgi:hypothetical protein